jgi:hypothetical protein
MEQSQQSKEILDLGNKLVAELKMVDSSDTLSRWMAHYVAELITSAENAEGEMKAALEKECFDTILKLWANRDATPKGIRPLASLKDAMMLLNKIAYKFDGNWHRYLEGSDNPWKKFGVDVNDANRDIIRLLVFLQSLDTDLVNVKKWVADHGTLLSAEEQEIVAGLDTIVSETEYYFQLEELRKDSKELLSAIITHLEKLVEKVKEAMEELKSNLSSKSRSWGYAPEATTDEEPID